MIIWFLEVPIIIFVIAAMLIGAIQVGPFLRTMGIILFVIGLITSLVAFSKDDEEESQWKWAKITAVFILNGIAILLLGIWFGDHNIFEFLFGTGWL